MCLSGGHSSPKESVYTAKAKAPADRGSQQAISLGLKWEVQTTLSFKSLKPFNRVDCFIRSEEQSEPELVL